MLKEKVDFSGYVYVLSNPSYGNLLKVGMTTKDPYQRANELSDLTAVPTPFKVEYYIYTENCSVMEASTHKILHDKGYRISENREFFNASLKEIKKVISSIKRLLDKV
ncbi:MAG: GIY-YIG nuclease family protein [Candidatus Sericytochromatia bacterium]|nr:GIY-YIG nuclease family protein [Candidatus Sericytochromatia bacterium]